ncbi:hypothetical protein LVD15_08395 [Fulvivirga maritima]|uniref:hypothetical protein n=1 Tax=Fulvivirga maritima TaxID=2904247 RepID=UPI001F16CFC7|nr:hypothetical protein [Fulvivirga maritima]UII28436.1 hypothetical protein LVD15_08395 [Fulvivirga maritima]
MIKTFTQDDVIRFIYNETTTAERDEIKQAMLCDAELEEQYKELLAITNFLDNSVSTPSDTLVSNIINYSKSLDLQPKK